MGAIETWPYVTSHRTQATRPSTSLTPKPTSAPKPKTDPSRGVLGLKREAPVAVSTDDDEPPAKRALSRQQEDERDAIRAEPARRQSRKTSGQIPARYTENILKHSKFSQQ